MVHFCFQRDLACGNSYSILGEEDSIAILSGLQYILIFMWLPGLCGEGFVVVTVFQRGSPGSESPGGECKGNKTGK